MASDRPEGEEERRDVDDVIEEVEEGEDGLGSPELMIKHPLQVGHGLADFPAVFFHISYWYLLWNTAGGGDCI